MTTPDSLIIRMAQVSDAPALARVRVAAWRVAYRRLVPDSFLDRPDFEEDQARRLRDKLNAIPTNARVSLAAYGDEVVGYCAYGPVDNDPESLPRGGIYDLYIYPDAWHQGIGRRLIACAIDYLNELGFSEATLFVFEGNTRARTFYEHLGWKTDGERRIDTWPDFSLPVLRYRTQWK